MRLAFLTAVDDARSQSVVELGRHQTARSRQVDLLLPLRPGSRRTGVRKSGIGAASFCHRLSTEPLPNLLTPRGLLLRKSSVFPGSFPSHRCMMITQSGYPSRTRRSLPRIAAEASVLTGHWPLYPA